MLKTFKDAPKASIAVGASIAAGLLSGDAGEHQKFRKYMFKNHVAFWLFGWLSILSLNVFAQTANGFAADAAADSVVTILLADGGQANAVGSGLVVRADGYVLTANHLVRGAREIAVRLRNGEIYDHAEIVSTDARRNVALLHVNAAGLHSIPNNTIEESQVGGRLTIVAAPAGQLLVSREKILNSVQLADSIAGVGFGFRVLQFDRIDNFDAAGGLLLDESGRSLGIVTTPPQIANQNIAVPFSSILGFIRTINPSVNSSVYVAPSPVPQNTPHPIPQNSVQMPERGVTALTPRGPGSVVIKPATPKEVLAQSKTIYIESDTTFFKPDQLVNALGKRPEIADWNLSFVAERDLADLIVEIDHVLFTYKFTFKLYSQRLGIVVATGDVIIFDGNLGANAMAKRVVEKLALVRAAGEPKKDADKDKKPDKKEKD